MRQLIVIKGSDDDFRGWNPQARWAVENGEELEYSHYQRSVREKQERVLSLLEAGPKFVKDIAKMTGLKIGAVSNVVKMLRQKGFEIERHSTMMGAAYTLKLKPKYW